MSVESSREAFLEALERLLSRPDAPPPGINAVAREAGLNKVLVYRYFDSWDGLLAEFAQRVNPWRDLRREAMLGLSQSRWTNLADFMKWLFRSYLSRLADSPLLQNLLRRSMTHRDPLQAALESDREQEGLRLMAEASGVFPLPSGANPAASIALLTSGLTWLVLAGTRAGAFNGLIFAGPQADALPRLNEAIDLWVDRLTFARDSSTL